MTKSLKRSPQSNAAEILEPAVDIPIAGGAAATTKMTKVINEMCKSDAGRTILEIAADNGYELKFDSKLAKQGVFGYADSCEECCALNTKNNLAQNIITLAHELRHAYQFTYEDLDSLGYSECDTRTMMLRTRTMEADAECYACMVAWELKEQGNDLCWKEMCKESPEITGPFEKTLTETGDMKKARTEAFKGWFDSPERRDSYDDTLVSCVEGVRPDVFRKKLKSVSAAKFVNAFCTDPDTGDNYFTESPKMLESGKYTAMYEDQKDKLVAHHQKRDVLPDRIPDKTIAGFETEQRPEPEKSNAHAVSAQARTIALDTRQQRSAEKIRQIRESHKKPALLMTSLLQAKGNAR